jgi:hypothetical protein
VWSTVSHLQVVAPADRSLEELLMKYVMVQGTEGTEA